MTFNTDAAADAILSAHAARTTFTNLHGALCPPDIASAYEVQDRVVDRLAESRGPVVGYKIATTTKVMQELMGIDHPCGGQILAATAHPTGASVRAGDFVNLRIECELAVRVATDLPATDGPYTPETIARSIAEIMPAFELIEDRNADYKSTDARTLIADNAWNGGVVLGHPMAPFDHLELGALKGRAAVNGIDVGSGISDRPLWSLAWVANLVAKRGRPLRAGMIVITGSLIPTFSVSPGDTVTFEIDGVGRIAMTAA